jgi:hypothetical protein
MPNDCWNLITLKATESQIADILTTEFTNVPKWAFQLIRVGKGAVEFRIWSAWAPNKDLMNRLLHNYPGIWIKNEWSEEGGHAGVIVGDAEKLQELMWDDGCIEELGACWRSPSISIAPVLQDN